MANDKPRWDKKTYRRHMFNRGRGVHSRHDVTNIKAPYLGAGMWDWVRNAPGSLDLDARKEYEQFTMPGTSWLSSDSTDRGNFREQDRKEVKQLFLDTLKNHHFAKHKKVTDGQLDKIVDAYMSQDDDKFKATLGKMGIQGKDADRWTRAAQDSAEVAVGEKEKLDNGWSDDQYASTTGTKEPGSSAPADGSPVATGPANGTRQVKPAGGQQAGGSPLRPKTGGSQPSAVSAGSTSRYGTKANDSGIYVNGARVKKDSVTEANVEAQTQETTQRESIQARREREREQTDAKSDPRRNYQKFANDQYELDRSMGDLRERKRAYREEQEQRRKDRRFKNRDLSNADDWNNLGREGSNRRNYEATANETAEQRNERTAAVEARNKQIAALRDRFAQMSDKTLLKKGETYEWKNGRAVVTREGEVPVIDADGNAVFTPEGEPLTEKGRVEVSADELAQRKDSGVGQSEYSYGNKFYANDPNRQKELAALGRLVNAAGKTISDAQIEAATKKLDSWQAEADERGARVQSYQNMRNAEEASRLRQQYGFRPGTISDDAVRKFHEDRQKETRAGLLREMQVDPQDAKSMTRFSDQWQKLMATGFDPNAALRKALEDKDTQAAYLKARASISSSDPDAADKRDQLDRRFILQQARVDNGIDDASANAKAVQGLADASTLPGRKTLAANREEADMRRAIAGTPSDALAPKRGSSLTIVHSAREARDTANALNQQIAQQAEPGMAQYAAIVARNREKEAAQGSTSAPSQAAAPVNQTAAPPIPEVPVIPRKKKTDEAQAAARGGVSALRPRRRG